ncbi:CgeB family protein [Terriglobus albidus]|uniref:CgeB family protein n=1 Tax=Terriglobus albidus TaxID=1592106 RepID=UPI0021E06E02|nr:glycosyltransferase [Terriglobus albidus]
MLTALARQGHEVVFFEKIVSYYADTQDAWPIPTGVELRFYDDLDDIAEKLPAEMHRADVAMVTSYCPSGAEVCHLVMEHAKGLTVFYDMDTPVTLQSLRRGSKMFYLPEEGLGAFDLVLSFTGGRALTDLRSRLGAKRVQPLYGWVDGRFYHQVQPCAEYSSALNYLGTYAADRQEALQELLLKPAQRCPGQRFFIAGAQYPADFPWAANIHFVRHLPPDLHPAFFCSGRATLNVTRGAMKEFGYCPSGRLFEAAACGVPIVTDVWEGLEEFFRPGIEILPVETSQQVTEMLEMSDRELRQIAGAAQTRVMENHTAESRACQLIHIFEDCHGTTAKSSIAA